MLDLKKKDLQTICTLKKNLKLTEIKEKLLHFCEIELNNYQKMQIVQF